MILAAIFQLKRRARGPRKVKKDEEEEEEAMEGRLSWPPARNMQIPLAGAQVSGVARQAVSERFLQGALPFATHRKQGGAPNVSRRRRATTPSR